MSPMGRWSQSGPVPGGVLEQVGDRRRRGRRAAGVAHPERARERLVAVELRDADVVVVAGSHRLEIGVLEALIERRLAIDHLERDAIGVAADLERVLDPAVDQTAQAEIEVGLGHHLVLADVARL